MYWLVIHRWLFRTSTWKVDIVAWSKVWTSANNSSVVGVEAIVHRICLDIHVPAVQEVAVEAVSCGIAIRKDKLATGTLVD